MTNIEDLIGPQFCCLCDRNIGQSVKIRSTIHDQVGSTGKPLVVCLECHRTGVPISSGFTGNQNTSKPENPQAANGGKVDSSDQVGKYVVLDNLQFPIFHSEWTAKEELLLLQGIMKCGMGNWIDISEQYVKSKAPLDCEEHYFTFYYKNKENNMPSDEQDTIILGPRQFFKNSSGDHEINIPTNEPRAKDAEKRIAAYHEYR